MEKNEQLANKILMHFNSLKEERDPWSTTVEEILKMVVPGRASMEVTTEPRGYDVDLDSLDGTALSSANLFANGLLGNVCSQRSTWFKLVPELPQHEDIKGLGEWQDSVQNVFYHMMATGGFYSAARQIFFDAATPGLGTMMMREDMNEQTLRFEPYAPKGVYIATDAHNKVDTVFHYFTRTARQILAEYGEGDLPRDFIDSAREKPFRRFKIVNAIFPREDRELYKLDSANKPWASVHILEGRKVVLKNSGYDSFPLSVFRYEYDSEETYPHSPSIDGAPDIRRLNRISASTTDLAQLMARPPQLIPMELYNDFKLQPNFKTKILDPNRVPALMTVNGQGYPIARDREELYINNVKEHYFANMFLSLQAPEGPNMTATEVLERQGEKASVIGGLLARLLSEFLDPVFDRMLIVAARNEWIPRPPDEVIARKLNLKIDYLGPLAQAQQRFLKLQSPVSSLQNFMPMLQAYPEMRDILKPYEVGKLILVGGGMPNKYIKEEEQFNQEQAEKQKMAQQQQQAETDKLQADAMAKGGKAPEPGSPTDEMMKGA
jgi:hypothetical protein